MQNLHCEFETQLADVQKQLEDSERRRLEAPAEANSQLQEDLPRRFEMAVDDVRQLKRRIAELEEELAAVPQTAVSQSRHKSDGPMDWESTKKRLLAELEGDAKLAEDKQSLSDDDRMTVEGAIRITDQMVIERDREIDQLKRQLSNHAASVDSVIESNAADRSSIELLDKDEIVQQERQRLLDLQREWQDKLRQAEVEISVHRARIARERSEVDEKLRVLESEKAAFANQQPGGEPSSAKGKKPGGRWLARLGLKESDRE